MVFMILGIFTIVLAIFACLQLATEFVVTAVCYFIFVVALILLLIGAGAFWVNISPSYPSFVNNTFDRAYNSFDDYRIHQSWGLLQSEVKRTLICSFYSLLLSLFTTPISAPMLWHERHVGL